jgi:hypothetical protein
VECLFAFWGLVVGPTPLNAFIYFLCSLLLFANIDEFKHILVVNTFVLAKNNMDQRE